jgi:DNA-binding response OmpR family regulator
MGASAEKLSHFPSLAGSTILILEDDEDTMELLRAVLGACGARVLLAPTTQTARGYLHTGHPDLIVSDLALPKEDGFAFNRWLRAQADPRIAGLPVVAVTAFYEDYPATHASGFAAYFRKPVPIDELVRTIADLLHPPHERRAS